MQTEFRAPENMSILSENLLLLAKSPKELKRFYKATPVKSPKT